jgi:choline dehydrogenase-like flavoprotein
MSQNFLFGDALQVVSDRFSEPVANANNLKMKLWTSESLGGASRINGMIFTQGPPADYNSWAEMGLDDWGWDRVEPYFRKSENSIAHPDSTYRKHKGSFHILSSDQLQLISHRSLGASQVQDAFPLGQVVSSFGLEPPFRLVVLPVNNISIDEAAARVGLPLVDDVNDPTAPAMGIYRLDHAVDGSAQRRTAYQAFLNKGIALARRNHLVVCTGVVATHLDISEEDGYVRGVHIRPVLEQDTTGHDGYVKAKREIILCCGAFKTPQLLMLSGVGPREELASHGIPVIRNLPYVGKSLSDHYAFPIMLEMSRKETIHILEWIPFGIWHMLLWFFLGIGLMSHGSNTSTIFARTGAIDEQSMNIQARDPKTGDDNMDITQPRNSPNLEVMIMAVTSFKRPVPGRPLFTLYPCITQPYSTGMVQLSSTDPLSHPRITHPTLRDERDWPIARKALRFAMRLAAEFQTSGYPHPVPIAFAPGNNLDKLAEWDKTEVEGYDTPMAGPTSTQPPLPSASLDNSSIQREGINELQTPKTWATVTQEELDRYIRSVATVSLHPSCSCRMSNIPEAGVVDQRLRVHSLRNLRITDTSIFPRIPSTHTMWPVIMVAERCADFIKKDWAGTGELA